MARKSRGAEPEPKGGRAAARLEEFMEQRLPEAAPESLQASDPPGQTDSPLEEIRKLLQTIAAAQERLEDRIDVVERHLKQLDKDGEPL